MTNLITLSITKYKRLYSLQSWRNHVPSWYQMTTQEVDQISEVSKQMLQTNKENVDCRTAAEFVFDQHGNLVVTIVHDGIATEYYIIG